MLRKFKQQLEGAEQGAGIAQAAVIADIRNENKKALEFIKEFRVRTGISGIMVLRTISSCAILVI